MRPMRDKEISVLTRGLGVRDLLLPVSTNAPWQSVSTNWVNSAHALRDILPESEEPPSAGELACATAIQAACACMIAAHLDAIEGYDSRVGFDEEGDTFAGKVNWNLPTGLWPPALYLIVGTRLENPAMARMAPLHRPQDVLDDLQHTWEMVDSRCSKESPMAPFTMSLSDILREPARKAPNDLNAQLQYIREHWGPWLTPAIQSLLLSSRDLLEEENRFRGGGHGIGEGGTAHTPDLNMDWGGGDSFWGVPEKEGFSEDTHWMTNLVLIAKHSNVWLDQLTKEYGEPVERLDQIPDAALDRLASQGFTGLWLIGLWERSQASKSIKRMRGNTEADASAYALYDYQIAGKFGGEHALQNLRERARQRGIRLAADMVPNHFGLDSRWMGDHPERFLRSPDCPFPGYSFSGANLSSDSRFQVYLEDGYWNETDAAVVFKRVDSHSGAVDYIYHGNDGTQMPWNDTAQLDYSNADVREAVIQVILDVARRFPIIRFDAAMTLAKRHIQRLWFPTPGDGGAIPSRSAHSLTDAEFHATVPREFWREVVERVAEEVPDTLLLAEAFWMMEAYFVRNLGMHRVYNSAFMHMLRDENNQGYRDMMKETLRLNPGILERFVNFMNNPDEDTAVAQFGKGEKYFGVTTLMATLPGLPMFGHGQVEGFAEKYGMEFTRATQEESVDEGLLAYHRQVIFPLLHSRSLYGSTQHFALFDLQMDGGQVAESVFAYSNRGKSGQGRTLVVYNNCATEVSGRLSLSSSTNLGTEAEPSLKEWSLSEALHLSTEDNVFYGLREIRSGSWYLRKGTQLAEEGLFLHLRGYEAQVFHEVQELRDEAGKWHALWQHLDGKPCGNLHEALEDLHQPPATGGLPRCGGILLHPTSLPNTEGIGTLGQEAIGFLDWLAEAGCTVWQMLPLCQAGPGQSPYSSPASFVGNPLMIDLQGLISAGLLTREECVWPDSLEQSPIDFEALTQWKLPLLRKAALTFIQTPQHDLKGTYLDYLAGEEWLADTMLFLALSKETGLPWWEWPTALARREAEAIESARIRLKEEIEVEGVLSFFFDRQWEVVRKAAEERGILLMGDLPLYVARDSADVWTQQNIFELNEDGLPLRVAAVPPDAFSDTGQLWGNPLFRWDAMKDDGYSWWIKRIERSLQWTPMIRLDHFRGFSRYYAVDAGDDDARNGTWINGPGMPFFRALEEAIGDTVMIAEDLGDIDEDVHILREETGYLCMRVLQFGFEGDDASLHRSAQCPVDAVTYTGTHDNNTTAGWWNELPKAQQLRVAEELSCAPTAQSVVTALLEEALGTQSTLAILPAQDLLGLGSEGRMNTPGTGEGNWTWRLERALQEEEALGLWSVLERNHRLPTS